MALFLQWAVRCRDICLLTVGAADQRNICPFLFGSYSIVFTTAYPSLFLLKSIIPYFLLLHLAVAAGDSALIVHRFWDVKGPVGALT